MARRGRAPQVAVGRGVPAEGGVWPPQAFSPQGPEGCAGAAAGTPLWKEKQGAKFQMSPEQQTPE